MSGVGAGVLLAVVIKPYKWSPKVFRLDQYHCRPGKERRMLIAVMRELSRYRLLVGHNIAGFDWNFLKTRAVVLGVPLSFFSPAPLGYDTCSAFKRSQLRTTLNKIGKPSAGLDMVTDLFGIKQEKTKIYPRSWWDTIWGEPKERTAAMDAIVRHCIADVRMNEQIYDLLLPIDSRGAPKRLP